MSRPNYEKLNAIEALRGIASLYVVAFHLTIVPGALTLPGILGEMLSWGWTGVTLFFVISAFTLTLSGWGRSGESDPTLKFLLRRFFRIAPLFWFWLIFRIIRFRQASGHFYSGAELLENTFFVFNFIPGKQDGIVWASWTIGVEMLFYTAFPLLAANIKNLKTSIVVYLLSLSVAWISYHVIRKLIATPELQHEYIKYSLLIHLPKFAVGIVAFFIFRRLQTSPTVTAIVCSILIPGTLIAQNVIYRAIPSFEDLGYIAIPIAYALLTLVLLNRPIVILVNRCTLFFGKISYSTYLNHMIVLTALAPIYRRIADHVASPTLWYGLSLAASLAVLTPLSLLTFRYIETPGIALGKRLITYLNQRRTAGLKAVVRVAPSTT